MFEYITFIPVYWIFLLRDKLNKTSMLLSCSLITVLLVIKMILCAPTICNLHISQRYQLFTILILLIKKVNYYINNSGKVYACTLEASKAFDRVNLLTLFKMLFKRTMCPLFLRFLIHSYCNQKMLIKWNAAISCSFDTSNGIKQGGVLSPLLFNVYLDELILLLREQGVGCHMNGMFVGAFCYADDVTLLVPTGMALSAMLDTCTRLLMHITSYLIHLRQNVCLLIGIARNYIVMFDLWVDLLSL